MKPTLYTGFLRRQREAAWHRTVVAKTHNARSAAWERVLLLGDVSSDGTAPGTKLSVGRTLFAEHLKPVDTVAYVLESAHRVGIAKEFPKLEGDEVAWADIAFFNSESGAAPPGMLQSSIALVFEARACGGGKLAALRNPWALQLFEF